MTTQSEHSKRIFRNELNGMDAYSRHKRFVRDYIRFYGNSQPKTARVGKTELDILQENHRFVREADENDTEISWEQRIAKRYYEKLFKEYAICDLKRYKEGKIAMRWRTENEVVVGKGQFECGSTRCNVNEDLKSWEVNFGYMEDGDKKNELVKLRLCPDCSYKLNYKTQKRQVKSQKLSRKDKRSQSDVVTEEHAESRSKRRKHSSSSQKDNSAEESIAPTKGMSEKVASVWKTPVKIDEEKTTDDQLDSYFADLLQ
ncbi:hypothetical protein VKS41_000226 [Umbelopsis sp. WA50703]